MRLIQLRATAVVTSVALLAGAAGIGSLASLASAAVGGPTVMLASTSATTTNAGLIPVTVTFSEAVTGFTSGDITATNATVMNFAASSTASTTNFSFNLDPTADGSVTAQVAPDMANSVSSSTGNQMSNMLTFTSDTASPTVTRTVTATPTTATFDWVTNESTNGQVSYGLSTPYTASTTMETGGGLTHTAMVTGLTASTTYHYEIVVTDAAGNTGTTGDLTFTTPAAAIVAAPVLSNITTTGMGTSTATITWNTNTAATNQVFYGTTSAYGSSSPMNAVASTSHSVTLNNLSEATLYHFQVQSTNAGGTSTSSDMTFMTNSTASSTPLAVTGVDVVRGTATADGTYGNGFAWVIHFTVPSNETTLQMRFADFTSSSSSSTIPVAGNVRYYSAQSSNASTAGSAITATDNNYGGVMTLTGDTSATMPGRQVSVTVEVKVPVGTPNGVYSTLFGTRTQ